MIKLYHIVAVAENRVIGTHNRLPWHFPADLEHFKVLTMGSTLIMGRKTFDSIGKPLPGRENFVLSHTHHPQHTTPHLHYFPSLEEALKHVPTPLAFIIGGASLYQQTIEQVDGIWLTCVEGEYEGDVFYPAIPHSFREKERKVLQTNPRLEAVFYERG